MPAKSTINPIRERPVHVGIEKWSCALAPDSEKQWCIVIMTVLTDSKIRPPYIIQKSLLKGQKPPNGAIIRCKETNGCITHWY